MKFIEQMTYNQGNTSEELDFKVLFATSEESGYKAERLLEHNVLGSGWRSLRRCSYPQSIAISFDQVYKIQAVQFTTHEFLVPSFVELLLYNSQQQAWETIGKVQMGKDGHPTAGRERKTVKLDIRTNAVRLVLHKPLPHQSNNYDQVGIAAITVLGNKTPTDIRPVTPQLGHPIVSRTKRSSAKSLSGPSQDQSRQSPNSPSYLNAAKAKAQVTPAPGVLPQIVNPPDSGDSQASRGHSYLEKGEELRTEIMINKSKAAAAEDFLLADRYKIAYDALGSLLTDYASLDERKAAAIAAENYKGAHEIKTTMKEVENILQLPLEKLVRMLNGEPEPPSPKPASSLNKGNKPKHQVSYQSLEPMGDNADKDENDLTTNDIGGAPSDSVSRQVRDSSKPRSKPKTSASGINEMEDLSRAVPNISNADIINENGERMLHNNNNGYQQFFLTEEEKRELEQERRESYMRRKGANLGASMMTRTRTITANSTGTGGNDELGASARMRQGVTKSQVTKSQLGKTGTIHQFSFDDELNNITSNRDKETAPPELPGSIMRGQNATKLKDAGFNEMYIRLAYSSNKSNVIDAINLMIRALVHDPVAFYPAGISLIAIISESTNTALIGLIGNLFCHVYFAIMRRYRGSPNGGDLVGTVTQVKNTVVDAGDMTLTFLDVTAQLSMQKENSVTYAELKCASERTVEKAIGQNMSNLYNDVLLLLTPIIHKLSDSQRRTKINSINMLATASTFPFFPTFNFVNAIISRRSIEKASGLAQNELSFQNQKLIYLMETRSWATAILITGNQRLMTKDTIPILRAYIEWVIPHATKQEQKKPATDILISMYGSLLSDMIGITDAVECANKACTTEAILKTVHKAMIECDKKLGIKPPRVKLFPPSADAPAGKLVIDMKPSIPSHSSSPESKRGGLVNQVEHNSHDVDNMHNAHIDQKPMHTQQQQQQQSKGNQQMGAMAIGVTVDDDDGQYGEFPPGVCQFCLEECGQQEDMALNMYRHLLIKCPCCCACPACEAIIEIPCLPEHMIYECTHKGKLQYSLDLCKNCRCIIETKYMASHMLTCKTVLGEEETICPLCGELLPNSEAALTHYSDGEGCPGNPRTAANLRTVVSNKVNSIRHVPQ